MIPVTHRQDQSLCDASADRTILQVEGDQR
jgi:hypothetical protein